MTQAAQFPLSTDLTVSVTNPPPGFAGFNTGNLAIFSDDPYANSFPASGIQYYNSPTQVGLDFGTSSKTYAQAVAVFSQNPNILLPQGQLIVIAMKTATVTLTYSGVPASGTFELVFPGGTTAAINWNDTAAQVQAKIQAVPGAGGITVAGTQAGELLTLQFWGVYGESPTLPTVTANSLQTSGSVAITITVANTVAGESITDTLNRTVNLVPYAAVVPNEPYSTIGTTDFTAAAAAFQAVPVLLGIVGSSDSLNQTTGDFYKNTTAGNTHTRCLTYLDNSGNSLTALEYLAAYFSLLLSVDYEGSNTTLTMNMKQLATIPPDDVIQPGSQFNDAKAAGSDVYILSITGLAGARSFGANLYADEIANELWLQGAILTAYFNALATVSTKIPQTEDGMNEIKAAIRQVLLQAVANGMVAPGSWQSASTFGNIQDFFANITQFGFYMFSTPISQQSESQRVARTAPLLQIAVKLAGAVQNATVIITVNP